MEITREHWKIIEDARNARPRTPRTIGDIPGLLGEARDARRLAELLMDKVGREAVGQNMPKGTPQETLAWLTDFAEKVQDWRDEWGEAVYQMEDADACEAESARLMEEAGMA